MAKRAPARRSGTTAGLIRLRLRGRRNASLSRDIILSAARDEFVEHGLNGARVDRIATAIGASKNLIYHYFGSKDGLYLAVLEDIYRTMRVSQGDDLLYDLDPVEGMRRLVANTFDHFARTPALIRLMSIENIHYARHLRRSKSVRKLYPSLLEAIAKLLAQGQSKGVFARDIDPVDLYISVASLAYFYLSNQYTLSWIFRRRLAAPKRLAARRAHVVAVILGYLRNRP